MKVLFVDDEKMVLSGIKRALYRTGWTLMLATSAKAALAMMENETFDYVISDIRMPGMDGVEFLNIVTESYPQTIRMVLSGQADQMLVSQIGFAAHQWFSKPCDHEDIIRKITHFESIRQQLPGDEIKHAVGKLRTLPAPPKTFLAIKNLMEKGASVASIGKKINENPAISAKLIQIANSAFFNLGKNDVAKVEEAIVRLGLDLVSDIIVIAELYTDIEPLPGFNLEQAFSNSLRVALLARELVTEQDKGMTNLAGLLHNIGQYVMCHLAPEKVAQYIDEKRHATDILALESTLFHTTNYQLAAYLLHLWNFPYQVVEAILFAQSPDDMLSFSNESVPPCVAIYIAISLLENTSIDPEVIDYFNLKDNIDALKNNQVSSV